MSELASEPSGPTDWDAVDAWAEPEPRPAPRKLGPARSGVLAAMMLGLQEALEPQKRDEVVIEVDAPDGSGERIRVHLDPVPQRSVAVIPPP